MSEHPSSESHAGPASDATTESKPGGVPARASTFLDSDRNSHAQTPGSTRALTLALFAIITAGYLIYSQTLAFHWDEGFHLLAARAIKAGKIPYRDFIFPQAPLNAMWNSLWLRVFGDSWRATHVAASLLLAGTLAVTAGFARRRFPDASWRGMAALAAVLLFGLNLIVVEYGPIAQAYAFVMLMMAAALSASVAAAERASPIMAAIAGLFAGAAVCATMLAALAGPVFLIWILVYSEAGNRVAKFFGFAAAAIVALSPIAFLFAVAPRQTWFNLVMYQLKYRRVDWPGAGVHDLDVLTSWIDHPQNFLMLALAIAAIVNLARMSRSKKPTGDAPIAPSRWPMPEWSRRERAPFVLCLWVSLAVALQNGLAHPTFIQYFLPMAPAITILSLVGFYALAIRLEMAARPGNLIAALACVGVLGMGRGLLNDRESYTWKKVEEVAGKVKEVTPGGQRLLASEQIYFLLRLPAPEGMEFNFAHKLDLGAKRNALLHILPFKELEARISAREYVTDAICDDNDEIDRVDQLNVFEEKKDFGECTVFWGLKSTAHSGDK